MKVMEGRRPVDAVRVRGGNDLRRTAIPLTWSIEAVRGGTARIS
jgi:hypothetical protein